MKGLKEHITKLPTIMVGGGTYLSYQAVTNKVAAFLLPDLSPDQIDEASYKQVLETADSLCRELGYTEVVKLTPPDVGDQKKPGADRFTNRSHFLLAGASASGVHNLLLTQKSKKIAPEISWSRFCRTNSVNSDPNCNQLVDRNQPGPAPLPMDVGQWQSVTPS